MRTSAIFQRLSTATRTATEKYDETVSIVHAREASKATVVHRTPAPVNYEVPDTPLGEPAVVSKLLTLHCIILISKSSSALPQVNFGEDLRIQIPKIKNVKFFASIPLFAKLGITPVCPFGNRVPLSRDPMLHHSPRHGRIGS